MEPRIGFQGINSASLRSLADRYDNPIPTRFLAPIDCLKVPVPICHTRQPGYIGWRNRFLGIDSWAPQTFTNTGSELDPSILRHSGSWRAADVKQCWIKYILMHSFCIMIIHTYMKITAGLWFRFREVYYWDSYWTIKGLLLSELYDTTEGMLRNFKVLHYSKIRIE